MTWRGSELERSSFCMHVVVLIVSGLWTSVVGDDAIRFGGMIIGWNLYLSICTNIAGCVKFVFRCFRRHGREPRCPASGCSAWHATKS